MERDKVVSLLTPLARALMLGDVHMAYLTWHAVGEALGDASGDPALAFQQMTVQQHRNAGHWMVTKREPTGYFRLYWEDPKNRYFGPVEEKTYGRQRDAKVRAIRYYGCEARRAAW